MVYELTPAGRQAIWQWVQERAESPDAQSETDWHKHALRSINLIPEGEALVVCMRGAVSRSGYLEALRLRPQWFQRVAPARPAMADLASMF